MEYTFKEGQEELSATERTIEKRGHVITFTIDEITENSRALNKMLKELKGKRDYEAVKMANVEQHHPFVKEMPEMDRFTVHMYQEAASMVKACDKKIDEIETQLKEDEEEIAEIKKQLPQLDIPEVEPAPENVEAEAVEEAAPTEQEVPVESAEINNDNQ